MVCSAWVRTVHDCMQGTAVPCGRNRWLHVPCLPGIKAHTAAMHRGVTQCAARHPPPGSYIHLGSLAYLGSHRGVMDLPFKLPFLKTLRGYLGAQTWRFLETYMQVGGGAHRCALLPLAL